MIGKAWQRRNGGSDSVGSPVATMAATLALSLAAMPHCRADTAMVLVESLSAPVSNVAEMDYVAPGTTIDLGASTVIVLDHLASCTRETVTGGVLHVGPQVSQDEGGAITRSRMDCDGHHLQLDASTATGGGQVYREALHEPLILHSTAPVIVVGQNDAIPAEQGGVIHIERVDQQAAPIELRLPPLAAGKRTAIDMAKLHLALAAGANYRLLVGDRTVLTFQVAPDARGVDAPLLMRLLPI